MRYVSPYTVNSGNGLTLTNNLKQSLHMHADICDTTRLPYFPTLGLTFKLQAFIYHRVFLRNEGE